MFTGRSFRLRSTTMGIEVVAEGKRFVHTIPNGEIVSVIFGPADGDRMLDVLWRGRHVMMFVGDLEQRADDATTPGAMANRP